MRYEPMTGTELNDVPAEFHVTPDQLAHALEISVERLGEMASSDKAVPAAYSMAVEYMREHPRARPPRPPIFVNGPEMMALWDEDDVGLFDGKEWGPWRFSADSMTLDFNSREVVVDRDVDGNDVIERREDYYIELSRTVNAEGVLDWLGQIENKGWGPAATGYLVSAFDEILTFQGRLAHGNGFRNWADLKQELSRRVERTNARRRRSGA